MKLFSNNPILARIYIFNYNLVLLILAVSLFHIEQLICKGIFSLAMRQADSRAHPNMKSIRKKHEKVADREM